MNGRQLLSLVLKDRYSTGEQKCKGHFAEKEACGPRHHGVYIRAQFIVSGKESSYLGRMVPFILVRTDVVKH